MPFFSKIPVTIEARRLYGTPVEARAVCDWVADNGYEWLRGDATDPESLVDSSGEKAEKGIYIDPADGALMIRTLEGDMKASLGDWIIKGVQGEFYPCKSDIFDKTYCYNPIQDGL